MVVNEAHEMESKLNEQIEVQRQEIEKLDQQNTSYKQKLTDKGLETKTVETQTEEKHLARELLPDSELNKKNSETKKKNSALFSRNSSEQEENKPEFNETPSRKIIQSVEQGTQTRTATKQNQKYNIEYKRCERKNGKRRVRQHKTINSFEVGVINDDHIQPKEKSSRKVAPQTTLETELEEISQNSFGHRTLESALKEKENEVVRSQTNNGIGVNIIGHQTLESAVAEEEVMAPAADPMKGEGQPLLDIHNLQKAFQRNKSLEEEKKDKENSEYNATGDNQPNKPRKFEGHKILMIRDEYAKKFRQVLAKLIDRKLNNYKSESIITPGIEFSDLIIKIF
ncbi:hypothetical protein JTB14_009976 [Gonioctena quinquepunctata]|nr:hypothetical protein JTB14_009976 [Gonioctena quinquepunctata]